MLANGRIIAQQGFIPQTDPFSWSAAGAPWHNDQWLSSWLFFQIYQGGGLSALHLLKALLLGLTLGIGLSTGYQLQAKKSWGALTLALALCLAWAEGAYFFDVRAYLFSYLGLTILWRGVLLNQPLGRLPLVLLFVLWSNLHAGVSAGLLLLALAAGWDRSHRRTYLQQLLLAILCCCCNPSGVYLLLHPVLLLGSPWGRYLNEWQPVWRRPQLFASCLLHLLAWCLIWTKTGLPRREGPLLCLSLFCLTGWRHIPLLAFLALPLWSFRLSFLPKSLRRVSLLLLLLLLSYRIGPGPQLWVRPFHLADPDQSLESTFFPQQACHFLHGLPEGGRLFHPYGLGGYLSLCAPARFPVCIDGRAVQVYPWECYRDYLRAAFRPAEFEKYCTQNQVHWVLLFSDPARPEASLRLLERSSDWQPIYQDPLVTLLRKKARPPVSKIPFREARRTERGSGTGIAPASALPMVRSDR